MSKKRDLPCSMCGRLMWSSKGSLPPGQATCQPCRRSRPGYVAPKPVAVKSCAECEAQLPKGRRRFCSDACKWRWWAKQRDSGRSSTRDLICGHCGQEFVGYFARAYCSLTCKRAARNQRRKPPDLRDFVIGAMIWLHGIYAPQPHRVRVIRTVGVMAYCPHCSSVLVCVPSGARVCLTCATEVELNNEEVDAVLADWIAA